MRANLLKQSYRFDIKISQNKGHCFKPPSSTSSPNDKLVCLISSLIAIKYNERKLYILILVPLKVTVVTIKPQVNFQFLKTDPIAHFLKINAQQ